MIEVPSFSHGNSKLPDSTITFSLPSGHSCPGASACLARANRETGRISDGPRQEFRCYEVSAEARFSSVRDQRWKNFELIRHLDTRSMAGLLLAGLTNARNHKSTHVRWFTGGDFFSPSMRDAVIDCALRVPDLLHYAYTKSVPFFVDESLRPAPLPPNLVITVSWGGRWDHLIKPAGFRRTARVLNYESEAKALGLPVDTTDRFAWQDEPTHFCHLSHGGQAPGSDAGAAIRERRRRGEFAGYSSKRRVAEPQLAG